MTTSKLSHKINVPTRLNKRYMRRLCIQRKELYKDTLFLAKVKRKFESRKLFFILSYCT